MSETEKPLPEYVCHKTVNAAKITSMRALDNGNWLLVFGEINLTIEKDVKWAAKFAPATGGYYVVYADGYASFSPAKAFEEGYTIKD